MYQDECIFPPDCLYMTYARFITSCVGVNAVICIRSVSESSFKRSAFAFAHSNSLFADDVIYSH